ncbi:MAG: hypothetical protein H7336_06155 [Bacteriovorax sp.]|nr:hypothetical protein [Bacteriovorax sp.]
MKKIILFMTLVTILSACGKKESTVAPAELKGSDPLTVTGVESFVGDYDLIRMDTEDCGAGLQIIKLCEGVQVRNNHSAAESFCNINKGEIKTGDNRSSKNVTFEGNVIKSVALIFDERSTPPGKVKQTLISILTLEADGTLRKLSDSKAGQSSCVYQKR